MGKTRIIFLNNIWFSCAFSFFCGNEKKNIRKNRNKSQKILGWYFGNPQHLWDKKKTRKKLKKDG